MAAHSGKGSANGSGANPALDTDAADELAANFRPSWAAEDDDDLPPGMSPPAAAPGPAIVGAPVVTISDPPAPATAPVAAAPALAAPQAQKLMSAQTVIGMGSPVRSPEPSSEALDSQNVISVAPAPAKSPSMGQTQPMNRSPVSSAMKPVTRNAAPAIAPSRVLDSDEFPPIRSSKKGVILVVVGIGIAAGLGLFLKFALTEDPKPTTTSSPPATQAAPKENDIPPPPPKDEAPPVASPPATTVAKADPPPVGTAAEPRKADPPPIAKTPDPPRTVAAAPPKTPKQPASPPPAAAPPKTPPKSTGGGIVRDSPF